MARAPGTAVCYLRDSQGESAYSPVQYIPWVIRDAASRGLTFRGDEEAASTLARLGGSSLGDIYMDYGVSGNKLIRPGLAALQNRIATDQAVSHLYVPRRDRLARPDDPLAGMEIENRIRRFGVEIVMLDGVAPALAPGGRDDLGRTIVGIVAYDAAGRFRRELAQKLLLAKVKSAQKGHATGGEPPYGFRRWLVASDGTPVRELTRGEHVKMAGHHVLFLPTAADELAVIARIADAIETTPAGRIARQLTDEGVPPPGAGRGAFSGRWTPQAVTRAATHPLLSAVVEYGRRAMGDQQRLTPDGPRDLAESDFDGGRPRTVVKPDDQVIRAGATFDPVVAPDRRERILAAVEARGRQLKGKPREQKGASNPLGGRIFDMACGWPMYRNAKRGRFGYSCGKYMNSDGKLCSHNMVSGDAATRLVVSAIRQRAATPGLLERLRARLRALAEAEAGRDPSEGRREAAEKSLADARRRRTLAGNNMALASNPEQYAFLSTAFDRASADVQDLEARLRDMPPPRGPARCRGRGAVGAGWPGANRGTRDRPQGGGKREGVGGGRGRQALPAIPSRHRGVEPPPRARRGGVDVRPGRSADRGLRRADRQGGGSRYDRERQDDRIQARGRPPGSL